MPIPMDHSMLEGEGVPAKKAAKKTAKKAVKAPAKKAGKYKTRQMRAG